MVTCPTCARQAREGLIVCLGCGERLPHAAYGVTTPINPVKHYQTARFLELPSDCIGTTPLSLEVSAAGITYVIPLPKYYPIILGRSGRESKTIPDVDLSPYSARELGVSRHHAIIDLMNSSLTVMDLGSTNGTEVNGHRLKPHVAYPLRHYDVICLGKLVLHVLV